MENADVIEHNLRGHLLDGKRTTQKIKKERKTKKENNKETTPNSPIAENVH